MIDEELAELVDRFVGEAIEQLPGVVAARLEEVPVVLLDEPDARMAASLGLAHDVARDELCGLHTGVALTERSIERTEAPDVIHLFRRGLLIRADDLAAELGDVDGAAGEFGSGAAFERVLAEEVRVTLLHEIGHHFGLEEDDLERLGYA